MKYSSCIKPLLFVRDGWYNLFKLSRDENINLGGRRKRYCGDKFIRQGEFFFPACTKIDIY